MERQNNRIGCGIKFWKSLQPHIKNAVQEVGLQFREKRMSDARY